MNSATISATDPSADRETFEVIRTCGVCHGSGRGSCLVKCWQCNGRGERVFDVLAHEVTDADLEWMPLDEVARVHAAEQAHHDRKVEALRAANGAKMVASVVVDQAGRILEKREVPEWEHEANVLASLRDKRWIKTTVMGTLALTDEGQKALARALDRAGSEELTPYYQQVARLAIREPRLSPLPELTLTVSAAVKPHKRSR